MAKKLNLYFVIGGVLCAGAYAAGALDYLMQCLKENMTVEESVREYKIQIKAVAGTSAGGVYGLVFPHSLVLLPISQKPSKRIFNELHKHQFVVK